MPAKQYARWRASSAQLHILDSLKFVETLPEIPQDESLKTPGLVDISSCESLSWKCLSNKIMVVKLLSTRNYQLFALFNLFQVNLAEQIISPLCSDFVNGLSCIQPKINFLHTHTQRYFYIQVTCRPSDVIHHPRKKYHTSNLQIKCL